MTVMESPTGRMTPLEQLLVDVCTDTQSLKRVTQDPVMAFRAAGASDYVVKCLQKQRGSWISLALSATQPVPSQEQIDAFVDRRVREDAFFADRLRTEPRRILERSFSTRFPSRATFEVVEVAGFPTVVVAGLVAGATSGIDLTPYADTDIDIDVDTDVDVDVDTDIDTDIDSDVDAIVDVDTDVDVVIDTDVDNVVDTVVDTDNSAISVAQASQTRVQAVIDRRWNEFWSIREAMWVSRDDRVSTS
ncbi:MAG: hypothetical protein K9G05_02110 [Candidatus Nanopelagicales bacterium]|nr:hypothetical protein [Candidatus Nanopelagicales bacterium]MCF8539690.1 hypothetical protein [Candidatus Nanopelagicales bacterium]MCF8550859.1 hypothetical protein [Candidatus Nanopelagicales bacterium]